MNDPAANRRRVAALRLEDQAGKTRRLLAAENAKRLALGKRGKPSQYRERA